MPFISSAQGTLRRKKRRHREERPLAATWRSSIEAAFYFWIAAPSYDGSQYDGSQRPLYGISAVRHRNFPYVHRTITTELLFGISKKTLI
jgi:hypothetical protein